MARKAFPRRSSFIVLIGAAALALAILLGPAGRNRAANSFDWMIQGVDAVATFPSRMVNNLRHFSLDRLDPTCPQCF